MPRKYSDEFKDKAARQTIEMIQPWNATQGQACKHISTLLGIWSDTLRNWVRNHPDHPSHTITGKHTGGESFELELARLEKRKQRAQTGKRDLEVRISFFRSGARPPHDKMIQFIDENKDRFGVETTMPHFFLMPEID